MKELKHLIKSKTFRKYIFSFIIVFVLPFISIVILFNFYISRISQDIEVYHGLLGEQLKAGIDSQLYTITELSKQLSANQSLADFPDNPSAVSPADFAVLRHLSDELTSVMAVSSVVDSAFIYSVESDIALSSKGLLDGFSIYKLLYNDTDSYDIWKQRISSAYGTGFVMIPSAADNRYPLGISYISVMSYGQQKNIALVLNLKTTLFNTYSDTLESGGSHVAVFDSSKNIMFQSAGIFAAFDNDELLSGSPSDKISGPKNENYVYNRYYSELTGCYYVTLTPTGIYFSQINMVRNLAYAFIATMLLTAFFLIYVMARRAYRPLSSVLSDLKSIVPHSPAAIQDEFNYISGAFETINFEKLGFEQKLYQQTITMKDYTVIRLLMRSYSSALSVESIAARGGLDFLSDDFIVVSLWAKEFFALEEDELNLLQYVMCNIFQELFEACGFARAVALNDKTVVLINLSKEISQAEAFGIIASSFETGFAVLSENFKIEAYATVSACHQTLIGINPAYLEAEELSELITEQKRVIFANEIKSNENLSAFALLDEENKNKLMNYLLVGDSASACDLISLIIEAAKLNYPTWKVDMLRQDICSAIVGVLSSSNFASDQLEDIEREVEAMLSQGKLKIQTICELANIIASKSQYKDTKQKSFVLDKKAEEYIAKNYSDEQLTASKIADHLGIHVNYLSSLYKKRTGESILDTINFYRLSNAKNLLDSTNERIESIATKCGFSNSAGFIRVFKRYEGITPGQYRQMRKDNADE